MEWGSGGEGVESLGRWIGAGWGVWWRTTLCVRGEQEGERWAVVGDWPGVRVRMRRVCPLP